MKKFFWLLIALIMILDLIAFIMMINLIDFGSSPQKDEPPKKLVEEIVQDEKSQDSKVEVEILETEEYNKKIGFSMNTYGMNFDDNIEFIPARGRKQYTPVALRRLVFFVIHKPTELPITR